MIRVFHAVFNLKICNYKKCTYPKNIIEHSFRYPFQDTKGGGIGFDQSQRLRTFSIILIPTSLLMVCMTCSNLFNSFGGFIL